MIRLALATAIVLGFLVGHASAQEARPMVVDGVEGLWLPPLDARDAEFAVSELPRTRERLRLLGEDLRLADRQIATLREALSLTEQGRERLREAIVDVRRASEAWYRDPALWLAIGLVVGAAGVVAAFAAAGG